MASIDPTIFSRLTALCKLALRMYGMVTPAQPLCLPSRLQQLSLSHFTLDTPLANVPSTLHTVSFSSVTLSSEVFAQLSGVCISSLTLYGVRSDHLYHNIARLSHLTSLCLSEPSSPNCSALTQLAPLAPTLRVLRLTLPHTALLATILSALTSLVVLVTSITVDFNAPTPVECFPYLPKLRVLSFNTLHSRTYTFHAGALTALTALQNLSLFLPSIPPDATLLTRLRNLRSISLGACL